MEQTQVITKKKFYRTKWFWILAVSIFIGTMASGGNDSTSAVSTNTGTSQIDYVQSVGENGYLRNGSDNVLVSVSREALSSLTKSAIANDDLGIAQIIASGEAFSVKSETKVLVINSPSAGVREIRIIEGPMIGKSGFVPMEFVKKQ